MYFIVSLAQPGACNNVRHLYKSSTLVHQWLLFFILGAGLKTSSGRFAQRAEALGFILELEFLFRRTVLSMQVSKTHGFVILRQIFALNLPLLFSTIISVFLASMLTQTGAR